MHRQVGSNERSTNNQAIFSGVEFEIWACRTQLIPAEQYLIEQYLDKKGNTLEAGSGGGRILLAMNEMGFESMQGFEFVPELVERAKKKDVSRRINFEVGNAVKLRYADGSFDQLIYLQQVICLIENDSLRIRALAEANRILKAGGVALFSFLCFEVRRESLAHAPYLAYLTLLRKLTRSKVRLQNSPWLKLGGKMNLKALLDSPPYVYWYRLDEISRCLRETGFQIVAVGSTRQLNEKRLLGSPEQLARESIDGMLYVVARKRADLSLDSGAVR